MTLEKAIKLSSVVFAIISVGIYLTQINRLPTTTKEIFGNLLLCIWISLPFSLAFASTRIVNSAHWAKLLLFVALVISGCLSVLAYGQLAISNGTASDPLIFAGLPIYQLVAVLICSLPCLIFRKT